MDMTTTLLSESFAESMLIPNGYAKLLEFLVKNYLIERREMMPHCATLLKIYRENGEEGFELARTVKLTSDKKDYNASLPTPTPSKNSPYIYNMAVRNPFQRCFPSLLLQIIHSISLIWWDETLSKFASDILWCLNLDV